MLQELVANEIYKTRARYGTKNERYKKATSKQVFQGEINQKGETKYEQHNKEIEIKSGKKSTCERRVALKSSLQPCVW